MSESKIIGVSEVVTALAQRIMKDINTKYMNVVLPPITVAEANHNPEITVIDEDDGRPTQIHQGCEIACDGSVEVNLSTLTDQLVKSLEQYIQARRSAERSHYIDVLMMSSNHSEEDGRVMADFGLVIVRRDVHCC